jgi:hypothetical protein
MHFLKKQIKKIEAGDMLFATLKKILKIKQRLDKRAWA